MESKQWHCIPPCGCQATFFFLFSCVCQPRVTVEHPSEQRGRGGRGAGKSGGVNGGVALTGTQTQSNIMYGTEEKNIGSRR